VDTFRISFSGETLPGVDRDAAKRGLAAFYKLKSTAGVEGFFSGKPVILRRNLAKDEAAQLYVTLRRMGLDIRIEPDAAAPPSKEAAPGKILRAQPAPASPRDNPPQTDHEDAATDAAKPIPPDERGTPRRRRQPGAPNLFDIRPAAAICSAAPDEDYLIHAARIGAAVLSLAFLFVALRFAGNALQPDYPGLAGLAIDPQGQPLVVVDDQLLRHDRAGFPGAVENVGAIALSAASSVQALSTDRFWVLRPPTNTQLPGWLTGVLGVEQHAGRLEQCSLDSGECNTLLGPLNNAYIMQEPQLGTVLLADTDGDTLLRLSIDGKIMSSRQMPLMPPVSLARHQGLLYLLQGKQPAVLVLKPDSADFGVELARLPLATAAELRALARHNGHWWLLAAKASGQVVLRLDDQWQRTGSVALPVGSAVTGLQPWGDKLLLPDPARATVYRVAADASAEGALLEGPFSEEAIAEAVAAGDAARARQRMLQVLVLVLLFLAITGLLAFASFKSLQHKLYRTQGAEDPTRFDVSDERILWLDPAPDPSPGLRKLSLGLLLAAPVCLFLTFITPASLGLTGAVSLVLLGLAGFIYALQQSVGCHLGLVDDQLVLVDHRRTFRVGCGPRVQYVNNFIMIDDVVVYLGNALLPLFAEAPLREQFVPVVTRGIRVDNTTLRVKLIDQRHPLFYGSLALVACCAAALVLLIAS